MSAMIDSVDMHASTPTEQGVLIYIRQFTVRTLDNSLHLIVNIMIK